MFNMIKDLFYGLKNTVVFQEGNAVKVVLYHTLIARTTDNPNEIQIFTGGYRSRTTIRRINSLLDTVSKGYRVAKVRGEHVLNTPSGPVPFTEGVCIPTCTTNN